MEGVLVCSPSFVFFILTAYIHLLKSKYRQIGSGQNGSRQNGTKNLVDKTGVDEMGVNLTIIF